MNTAYRKLVTWLMMGAALAVSTRLAAADSPGNASTQAADILKASFAVYRNPSLKLSCEIYRRTLKLKLQDGDGSSPNDYLVTESIYQVATLRVRNPYSLYLEGAFFSTGAGDFHRPNFVAVKYGQDKGRFAAFEDGQASSPPLLGDELFLAKLRAGYGLTGDMVVESLLFGGALKLDYATASIKGEGTYLGQPVNQIEVNASNGAIMKLWIAKSNGLILHSLVIPVPGSKEVVETIYKDAIISREFAPGDFVFHSPSDANEFDPDRMGFATTEDPVAFIGGETIPASAGVVTIVGDHTSATGFYGFFRKSCGFELMANGG